MIQQSQQRSSAGYRVALGGGILATLAFLLFPYVSIGILGSYTAIQLANGVFGYSSPVLRLELLVALAIVGLGCFSLRKKGSNPALALIIAGLSGVVLLVLGWTYIQQSMQRDFFGGSVASYYSTGFWLYLAGITVALVGGIFQLSPGGQSQLSRQQPQPFQQPQQPHVSQQPPHGPSAP